MGFSPVGVVKSAGGVLASPGSLILTGIDKVLESRYGPSVSFATDLKARMPGATSRQIAGVAISQGEKELMTIGAATGGLAAVPAIGTLAALGTVGVDIAACGARIAEMVLRVAAAYEHPLQSIDERRAAVLTIILGGAAGSQAVEKLAGELGKGLSKQALTHISGAQLRVINRVLGRTIITKYGTKRGAIALGRVVPFGIGAAIGGGGNLLLAKNTGRYAIQFFDDGVPTGGTPVTSDDEIIDLESEEVFVDPDGYRRDSGDDPGDGFQPS